MVEKGLPEELAHNAALALACWQIKKPGSELLAGDALAQALGEVMAWHELERMQP